MQVYAMNARLILKSVRNAKTKSILASFIAIDMEKTGVGVRVNLATDRRFKFGDLER
jgi:hypothetical protein